MSCFYWKSYNKQKAIANAMAINVKFMLLAVAAVAACLVSGASESAVVVGVDAIQLRRESAVADAGYTRAVPHLTDLEWSDEGQLVFTELKMERSDEGQLVFTELKMETHAHTETELLSEAKGQLYPVKVNFDIEQFDPIMGISMMFDKQNHKMQLNQGLSGGADAIAWGRFEDIIESSGWSQLYLHSNPDTALSADVKMYAAGFVEGLLTCTRISQFY